jgi:hypothetical protein
MGMNDEHREMEGMKHKNKRSPVHAMARLTWWKYSDTEDVYENVISKRQIKGVDWKEEYGAFVHLTEKDGNSFTSDFLPSPAGGDLAPQSGAMDSVNESSTTRKCVINETTFTATYSTEDEKWQVLVNEKDHLVQQDQKTGKYFVRYEGKKRKVRFDLKDH